MMQVSGTERYEARGGCDVLTISPKLAMWSSEYEAALDPVTFEIMMHKLERVQDEFSDSIRLVSGAVAVTEAFDYNTVLTDEVGNIFSIGRGGAFLSPPHQDAIRWTLENRSENPGIEEGDMFLLGDPWVGVIHQADASILAPIFVDGKLFCWAGAAMHFVDVGGPGFTVAPEANTIFDEAAALPPIKLVRKGELQRDVEEMFLRRSKTPQLVALDMRALIAGANTASIRLHELINEYGAATVHQAMKQMLDTTEAGLRAALRRIPDGIWRHQVLMEVSGPGDRGVYQITGELRKTGDALAFDFTNCDPQKGFLSGTASAFKAASISSSLSVLCADLPWATGALERVFEFKFKRGTFASATFPAAVSSGAISPGMVSTALTSALLAKMLSAAPDDMKRNLMAVGPGGIPVQILQGPGRGGEFAVALSTDGLAGGGGGNAWRDGADLCGWPASTGVMICNIESFEQHQPLQYLYRREVADTGGPGRFRGGICGEAAVILHDTQGPLDVCVAAFGMAFPIGAGVNGALPAKSLRYVHAKDTNLRARFANGEIPVDVGDVSGNIEYPPPKDVGRVVGFDDIYHMTWAGGGGYGDPLERDPRLVLSDVIEGFVTRERAKIDYGVVIEGSGIDACATAAVRAAMRGARLGKEPMPQPAEPLLPADAIWLDGNLVAHSDGTTACARCQTVLERSGEGFRHGCAVIEKDLLAAGRVWKATSHYIDDEVVLREFACPGCGTLLESDVALKGAPYINDRQITGEAVRDYLHEGRS